MEAPSFLPGRTRQLVEISSMNDGLQVPDDRLLYTLEFRTDGAAQFEQRCPDRSKPFSPSTRLSRPLHQKDYSLVKLVVQVVLLTVFLFAGGCAKLMPLHLPDEYEAPSAREPLWYQLESVRSNTWIYPLNTGSEALEWRLRVIDSASQSIDLQTFLWKDDSTGFAVAEGLLEAAKRGVRVRLLLDDTFTDAYNLVIQRLIGHPNIALRIYNPAALRSTNMVVRNLINLEDFGRVNHRMHNKLLVADNRAAIVGGRNVADEYYGRHKRYNFRDFEILTAGPSITYISQSFDAYWNSDWSYPVEMLFDVQSPSLLGADKSTHGHQQWQEYSEDGASQMAAWLAAAQDGLAGEIQVVADRPAADDQNDTDAQPTQLSSTLIDLMEQAEEELVLVSAYLIPTPELEAVVEQAENRGVRVRILTNSLRSNNHVAAHSAYRAHLNRLLGHGAEVHEIRVLAEDRERYMDHPVGDKHLGLHAKLLLIDDHLSFVGSANLDPRSLRLNTEMGLLIRSPSFNNHLRDLLAIDFLQRNAWYLKLDDGGSTNWIAGDIVLKSQPAESFLQRLEDWLLGMLPIEQEL